MARTEGRLEDAVILRAMTTDDYYADLNTFAKAQREKREAHEAAIEQSKHGNRDF